jgi:hypothetical protein
LQLPGVWFHWVNTAMMLSAWRKVGFAGGRIDQTLIDRTHFIDRINVGSATTKCIEEVVATPPGMRTGSLAAVTAKLEAAVSHAATLEASLTASNTCGFDPQTVPFLMKPNELVAAKKRDRSQLDMTIFEGGSASLRNVRRTLDARRAVQAEKVAGVEERKEERALQQSDAQAAALQLVTNYERCAQACVCSEEPCPAAGLKPCGTCKEAGRPWLKPRICVVRECVAARKGPVMLALTCTAPSPAAQPRLLSYDGATASEDSDDEPDAVEVMPVAKPRTITIATLCDWACDQPEMTTEEVEVGYCSGRRCKANMHPACFLHHTGEVGAALGDVVCFCRSCWATQ